MHSKWAETIKWVKVKNLYWNHSLKFKICTISFCGRKSIGKQICRCGGKGRSRREWLCLLPLLFRWKYFFLIRWNKFRSLTEASLSLECALFMSICGLYPYHVDKWVTSIYKGLKFSAFCKNNETCSKCPLTWQKWVALPRELLYKIILRQLEAELPFLGFLPCGNIFCNLFYWHIHEGWGKENANDCFRYNAQNNFKEESGVMKENWTF